MARRGNLKLSGMAEFKLVFQLAGPAEQEPCTPVFQDLWKDFPFQKASYLTPKDDSSL